ncbi:hypothetical protein [Streptomyces litmocidini]|uniref:hypothetical protein n=1 Tax=Streptomyces litmocidini TaxID=67318 RepID=UPI003F541EAB
MTATGRAHRRGSGPGDAEAGEGGALVGIELVAALLGVGVPDAELVLVLLAVDEEDLDVAAAGCGAGAFAGGELGKGLDTESELGRRLSRGAAGSGRSGGGGLLGRLDAEGGQAAALLVGELGPGALLAGDPAAEVVAIEDLPRDRLLQAELVDPLAIRAVRIVCHRGDHDLLGSLAWARGGENARGGGHYETVPRMPRERTTPPTNLKIPDRVVQRPA